MSRKFFAMLGNSLSSFLEWYSFGFTAISSIIFTQFFFPVTPQITTILATIGMLGIICFSSCLKTMINDLKHVLSNPFKNFLRFLQTLNMIYIGSSLYYFCWIYLPAFLSQHVRLFMQQVYTVISSLIYIALIVVPIISFIYDKINKQKTISAKHFPIPIYLAGLILGYNIGYSLLCGYFPFVYEWLTANTLFVTKSTLYSATICGLIFFGFKVYRVD